MNRHVPALVDGAACAAATVGASLLYSRFFATNDYLLPLAVASVGGVLVALLAAARRWSSTGTLLAALAGFLLLATYGVFGATVQYGVPTLDTGNELLWGVIGGWARMLTVGLPADVQGDLLITPVLVTWAAAVVSGSLAARTRSVLAPVAPPLAAFLIALLVVGKRPGVQVIPAAVFLAGVLLLIFLRANRIEHTERVAAGFGVPAIALVAALGVAGGIVLPFATGQNRFDPRDLSPPPVWIADTLTPLAQLKNQLREQPPRPLFTVHADHTVDRIRTAALDEFNGTLWTSADKFVVAGRRLAADQPLPRTTSVTADIEIDGLSGPFLPVLGRPTRLDSDDAGTGRIGYSETSGALATTEKSPRGLHYTVTGDVSARDAELSLALPSGTSDFLPDTVLPHGLPAELKALARQLTDGEPTPYGQLVAIERYLRALPYSLDAEPGHSYGAVNRLLTGTSPHDDAGYAEQHAAAFAVLARAAGFPARVSVGYRIPDSGEVTTANAHAWAEVAFDGYGWVAFDPTDTSRTSTDPRPRPESPAFGPGQPNPPMAAPPVKGPLPDPDGEGSSGWGGALRTTAFAAIGLASLALIAALATAGEKARRRRRRRRAPSRSARVLGAWREMTDRLSEHGMTFPVSATASEIADQVPEDMAEPVRELAPLATTAVFAPDQVSEDDVRRAWHLEAQLRRRLAPLPLSPRWLRVRFDPRPLLSGWREVRQSRKSLRRLGVR